MCRFLRYFTRDTGLNDVMYSIVRRHETIKRLKSVSCFFIQKSTKPLKIERSRSYRQMSQHISEYIEYMRYC